MSLRPRAVILAITALMLAACSRGTRGNHRAYVDGCDFD